MRYIQEELFEVPKRGWWSRRVSFSRTWLVVSILLVLFVLSQVALVSFRLGSQHAEIRPVTVSGAQASSVAEAVYQRTHPSVVTINVTGGGTGSGFFFAKGEVLTNYHVVATSQAAAGAVSTPKGADVQVILSDGRMRTGHVHLADPRLDMAIVDVENASDVPPLSFADLTKAKAGEPVVVIGTPFGLEGTVSQGILSSTGEATAFREDPVQSSLLQTDAAVNPGNSGGPLLDGQGQVLGMVTLRPDTADGRSVVGVSFAIPNSLLTRSVNQLEVAGKVSYVIIGVAGRSTTPDDPAQGMYVASVTPGSGSAKAGLAQGDIITRLDAEDVHSYNDVIAFLATAKPGQVVHVTYVRKKQSHTVDVTLTERPEHQ